MPNHTDRLTAAVRLPDRAVTATVLVAVLAIGCSHGSASPVSTNVTTPATAPPVTLAPDTTPVPTTAPPSGGAPTTEAAPRRPRSTAGLLRPDGLGSVDFGTDADDATDRLAAVLGQPRRRDSRSESCGHQATAAWESSGITIHFVKGRFQGWRTGRQSKVTTPDGAGVGTTVAQLRATFGTRFEWLDDGLDNEFAVDRQGTRPFLGGVTDGHDDGARVKRLWAGYTCGTR